MRKSNSLRAHESSPLGMLMLTGVLLLMLSSCASSPAYNQVFRKATHNSYWLNVDSGLDIAASGVQQRIMDQLLHEHVRALEFDLHFESGHPGEFTIYHTAEATKNSGCHYLTDCLQLLQRFDYLVPDHEVVNVILEFKETALFGRVFGNGHRIQDLDRQLWEHLGSRIYTPREFLSRCQAQATLTQCAADKGWPTIEELRGRYIINVIGNWGNNYWDWIDYANDDGGIINRAAFPIRSMLVPDPTELLQVFRAIGENGAADAIEAAAAYRPEIEYNDDYRRNLFFIRPDIPGNLADPNFQARLTTARDASIFWQVEHLGFFEAKNPRENTRSFLQAGGVIRSTDAHDPTGNDKVPQKEIIEKYNFQLIQTDFPWHFILDQETASTRQVPLPTMPARPFFEAWEIGSPPLPWEVIGTRAARIANLTEPGSRLYFRAENHLEASIEVASPTSSTDQWEVQSSTTTITHDNKLPPYGTPGVGCLFVRVLPENEFRVCRIATIENTRRVRLSVTEKRNAQTVRFFLIDVPHQEPRSIDPGDMLLMLVTREAPKNLTRIEFFTAGTMYPNGDPHWNPLPQGATVFPGVNTVQGISAGGDVLFVSTRHNGQILRKSDFSSFSPDGNQIIDLSWCLDGSCRSSSLPTHQTTYTSESGWVYVNVDEAGGPVFGGQWRHLYTTDRYEATTSGLTASYDRNKFLLRRDEPRADSQWAPLYRCVDWRRDYHTFWLSRDSFCPNDKGPQGQYAGIIGYIATQPALSATPLYHLRKGTQNSGSDNTHDHYYAVGDAQAKAVMDQYGYEFVETMGFVYVGGKAP